MSADDFATIALVAAAFAVVFAAMRLLVVSLLSRALTAWLLSEDEDAGDEG